MTDSRSPTPLPWNAIAVLFVIMAAEMTAYQVVVPFAPFLVRSFGPGLVQDDSQIGYWVGWILAAFPFAQVLSAYPWGILSDKAGRIPCITAGLFGTAFFLFLFGFADTFWKAVLLRFCAGLANGNLGVVKSLLGEITDESNQARAFAIFGLATSAGVVLGPVIGGRLSNVADRYQAFDTAFLRKYPFFLPNAVIAAVVAICGLLSPMVLVLNTNDLISKAEPRGENVADIPSHDEEPPEDDVCHLLDSSHDPSRPSRFSFPLKAKYACVAYGMCAFEYAVLDDLFPLWSMQSRPAGLAYSTEAVGTAFAIKGGGLLIFGPFLVPFFQRLVGTSRMLILAACCSVVFVLTPEIAWMPSALHWPLVAIMMVGIAGIANAQFSATMLAINESAPRDRLGAINGVGQSTAALARTLGPLVATTLYSWSAERNLKFPFDIHLAFLVSSGAAIAGVVFGVLLHQTNEKQHRMMGRNADRVAV